MMNILIIGKNGQLGWELCRQAPGMGFSSTAVDLPEFDITHPDSVENQIVETHPDLVVNASAYTAVDKAESDPETAFAVNEKGPIHLADVCAQRNIPLIHVSTDYVFDGEKKGPYFENDPISPLGVYGKSKAAGDEAIRTRLPRHIIIRTAWLYGVYGNNFVKTMLRLGKERETLQIVSDQYGCPTFAADLAEAILIIANRISENISIEWGTYHYGGSGVTSWYYFARTIFELARPLMPLKVENIQPVPTEAYPMPAKRPRNSELDCGKIEKNFGIQTKVWQDRVKEVVCTDKSLLS
jgi:dTDP-4-dehydrorhamnose reductase